MCQVVRDLGAEVVLAQVGAHDVLRVRGGAFARCNAQRRVPGGSEQPRIGT